MNRLGIVLMALIIALGSGCASTPGSRQMPVGEAQKGASSQLDMERAKQALEQYEKTKSSKDLDRSISAIKTAIASNPEWHAGYFLLYVHLMVKTSQEKRLDIMPELRAAYAKAIELNPTLLGSRMVLPPSFIEAVIYIGQAESGKIQGNPEHVLSLIQQAIQEDPKSDLVHSTLALLYANLGRNDMALAEAKAAIQLGEENAEKYGLLGAVYMSIFTDIETFCPNENALKKASEAYQSAIRLEPENAALHMTLANILADQGRFDLARFERDRAVQIDSSIRSKHSAVWVIFVTDGPQSVIRELEELEKEHPHSIGPNVRGLLGRSYFLAGRYRLAIKNLATEQGGAKSEQDLYPRIWVYLARLHLGDKQGAAKDLRELRELRDLLPGLALWKKQLVSFHMGTLSESAFIAAAKDRCNKSEAFFYLGEQYLLRDNPMKAREFYQKSLEQRVFAFVEYSGARERLRLLDNQ